MIIVIIIVIIMITITTSIIYWSMCTLLMCYTSLSILLMILLLNLSESFPFFEKSNAARFLTYAFSQNRIDFQMNDRCSRYEQNIFKENGGKEKMNCIEKLPDLSSFLRSRIVWNTKQTPIFE